MCPLGVHTVAECCSGSHLAICMPWYRIRIEFSIDEIATRIGELDFNTIRCIFIDGHADRKGNIGVGKSIKVPPECIRIALLMQAK